MRRTDRSSTLSRRAFGRAALGAGVLAVGPAARARAVRAAGRRLAVVGGTLIDGTGRPPIRNAVLLVEGDRVAAAGPASDLAVPEDARRIDASGRWIVPGLIDAHVHFFQSGGLYTRPDIIDLRFARPYEEEIRAIEQALPATFARYLASGVTGAVDVGGPMGNFEVRQKARARARAPRVAIAGPLLATYAPPELRIADPPIVRIETPEEARAEVRRQLANGPDLIKIWFVFPKPELAPDLAWVRAAIDEAHAGGVRVVVHATQRRVARAVVEAGADILAHSIDDAPIDDALLERMRARGVITITTLMVRPRYRAVFGGFLDLTPIERRLGDPEVIASLDDLDELPKGRLPSWVGRARPLPLSPVVADNLVRVQRAGITVAAGSDAGNIGTLHGPSLHRELELMVEAGLTPMQVLRAASAGGAAVMGRSHELGTLEPGRLADFVLLDADPLEDIRNTRALHRVAKSGDILDPVTLLERLDD